MRAADFYSTFNPIISVAMARCGAARIPERKSGWAIDMDRGVLAICFATSSKYPWTVADGGIFTCGGWLLNRTSVKLASSSLSGDTAIGVLNFLDDTEFQRLLELNAAIKKRSPLARQIDAYALELRTSMEAQGLPVHPCNPRLDTCRNLHYMDAADVASWAEAFCRFVPLIVDRAKVDAEHGPSSVVP